MHLCTKKLIHKPNSGLELVVRQPKIQKVKEKKKTIIIKVENIGPNKIVVCTEMVMYYKHNCRGPGGSMS